jgi:signal transduction histidine kinase
MKITNYKIILYGLVLIIFFWFAEAFLHILIFDVNTNVIINLLFPPVHEYWMRIIVMFIMVVFSITSQRIVKKLHNMNDKLQKVEEDLRKSFNRSKFYKDLFTHDVNNIFSIINSSANLIASYYKSPNKLINIEEYPEIIQEQIIRGSKLVDNVRKLFELEEIKHPSQKLEVLRMLTQAINYVKKSYLDNTIDIQIDIMDEECFILGNELLVDIFENILINTIRYNVNSIVEIFIKISKEYKDNHEFIKMEFIDNGIGISDEKKKIIFEQNNRKYKGSKGMGIGLSLVKKIIDSYSGHIYVENRVQEDYSKGSNFILLIPRAS